MIFSLVTNIVLAPYASQAVSRPEHFVSFLIAMGSGDQQTKDEVIYRSYEFATLSYLCFQL